MNRTGHTGRPGRTARPSAALERLGDRAEEIALPLYGFALGSVVAGIDPLLVLVAILWWDARFAADAPTAVGAACWVALLIPIGPLAVALAAPRAARSIRRPWYAWGGALVAAGVTWSRWTASSRPSINAMAITLAAAAAVAVATPATSLLARLTRRLATTPLHPLVLGIRRTPLHLPPDDDFDSFP